MTKGMNEIVKKFASKEVSNSVNTMCWFFYQPKLPRGCERFKKSMK